MLSATEILAVLAGFASDTRLIELSWPDGDDTAGSLTVEAFAADELLQGIAWRDVLVLSANRSLSPAVLLNRRACIEISLADRSRARFSGVVSEVQLLGRHGRLARYRLRLSSWLWRLTQTRNCRVWQDKSVIDIVDEVFGAYLPLARWRWSAEVANFLAEVPKRVYCCQYRESDADFITRLLGEEGLAWPGAARTTRRDSSWCCSPTAAGASRCRAIPAACAATAFATTKPMPARRMTRSSGLRCCGA